MKAYSELSAAVWEFRTSPLFTEAERTALDFALAAASVPNGVTDEMFQEMRRWNDTMGTPLEAEPMHVGEKLLAPHGWRAGKHAPGAE